MSNFTVECVGTPQDPHEFELEFQLGILPQVAARGVSKISGVVCPECGEEQDLDLREVLAAEKEEEERRVKRGTSKKPKKGKGERRVGPLDPSLERGVGGGQ